MLPASIYLLCKQWWLPDQTQCFACYNIYHTNIKNLVHFQNYFQKQFSNFQMFKSNLAKRLVCNHQMMLYATLCCTRQKKSFQTKQSNIFSVSALPSHWICLWVGILQRFYKGRSSSQEGWTVTTSVWHPCFCITQRQEAPIWQTWLNHVLTTAWRPWVTISL